MVKTLLFLMQPFQMKAMTFWISLEEQTCSELPCLCSFMHWLSLIITLSAPTAPDAMRKKGPFKTGSNTGQDSSLLELYADGCSASNATAVESAFDQCCLEANTA